jgi:hypothetical protein
LLSGWKAAARVDEGKHVGYAAARIPLRSLIAAPVAAGTRWRMNLYRINAQPPTMQKSQSRCEQTAFSERVIASAISSGCRRTSGSPRRRRPEGAANAIAAFNGVTTSTKIFT